MTRHLLIRDEGTERVVAETKLPLEAMLHDALTRHPELLPAEDMGLGRTVVVGRESAFASGYADLILIDDRGQVCLVEVKKEGNPDTRRVVAQLLDYAAGLWGKTLSEFEQDVFLPYVQTHASVGAKSLHDLLAEKFGGGDEAEEDSPAHLAEVEEALAESLASGRFTLIVAAPVIPESVGRVLDYMNAQGLRLYGLEVSYFNGPPEYFVPRLAVQPAAPDQKQPPGAPRAWNEESILQQLRLQKGDEAADAAVAVFEWADSTGIRRWYGAGRIDGSCYFGREDSRGYLRPFSIWTYGLVTLNLGELAAGKHPSFAPAEKRRELQRRLAEAGIAIADDRLDKFPSFPLTQLAAPAQRQSFFSVIEWMFEQMNQT